MKVYRIKYVSPLKKLTLIRKYLKGDHFTRVTLKRSLTKTEVVFRFYGAEQVIEIGFFEEGYMLPVMQRWWNAFLVFKLESKKV